jgi:hypothetical protein
VARALIFLGWNELLKVARWNGSAEYALVND